MTVNSNFSPISLSQKQYAVLPFPVPGSGQLVVRVSLCVSVCICSVCTECCEWPLLAD